MSDNTHTVRQLLAEVCAVDPDSIRPDASLVEYGLDSARSSDLVVALEDAFPGNVRDEAIAKMKTLTDIVNFVEARKAS